MAEWQPPPRRASKARSAAEAEALGVRLAETLLEQGAAALLEAVP